MISLKTVIQRFGQQGEKTGWSYILIPAEEAQKLKKAKTSFRVKGKFDRLQVKSLAMIPMGEGDFIIPLNTQLRKELRKTKGDELHVRLELDNEPLPLSPALLECLADEPEAMAYFNKLPWSHRNYYSKWIESAKTMETKAKRISLALKALSKNLRFNQMMQQNKKEA